MARVAPGGRSACPIAYALDVFGDQWTLLVIRDLLLGEKRTFGDFQAGGEGIATNILADRLERLEQLGIVVRDPDPDDRRRARYYLTEKGLDLYPVLVAMIEWSGRHHPGTLATPAVIRKLRAGSRTLLARHREALRRIDRGG